MGLKQTTNPKNGTTKEYYVYVSTVYFLHPDQQVAINVIQITKLQQQSQHMDRKETTKKSAKSFRVTEIHMYISKHIC